jgi:hypothetical protein
MKEFLLDLEFFVVCSKEFLLDLEFFVVCSKEILLEFSVEFSKKLDLIEI